MMRIAERPRADQAAFGQRAREGMDHRYFECLARRLSGGRDTGQAGGKQRFTRTRRTAHEEVVATGGGDLQRAAGGFLAADAR